MGLFKKKETFNPISLNYTSWEQDLGFLAQMISRNIKMTKLFYVDIYEIQLSGQNAILTDEDLRKKIEDVVFNIIKSLSDNYINFLSMKYFNTKESLIEFISDNVYVEMIQMSIELNLKKLQDEQEKADNLSLKTKNIKE